MLCTGHRRRALLWTFGVLALAIGAITGHCLRVGGPVLGGYVVVLRQIGVDLWAAVRCALAAAASSYRVLILVCSGLRCRRFSGVGFCVSLGAITGHRCALWWSSLGRIRRWLRCLALSLVAALRTGRCRRGCCLSYCIDVGTWHCHWMPCWSGRASFSFACTRAPGRWALWRLAAHTWWSPGDRWALRASAFP